MSGDDIEREAAARSAAHDGQSSQRRLAKDYELTGLRGERWFAAWSGLEPAFPPDIRGRGDNGYDFVCEMWITPTQRERRTIDVKAARKPVNLLVEEKHVFAHIYVLVGIDDALGDGGIGWAWRREVLAAELKTMKGYKLPSHAILARTLRPLRELKRRLSPEPFV